MNGFEVDFTIELTLIEGGNAYWQLCQIGLLNKGEKRINQHLRYNGLTLSRLKLLYTKPEILDRVLDGPCSIPYLIRFENCTIGRV